MKGPEQNPGPEVDQLVREFLLRTEAGIHPKAQCAEWFEDKSEDPPAKPFGHVRFTLLKGDGLNRIGLRRRVGPSGGWEGDSFIRMKKKGRILIVFPALAIVGLVAIFWPTPVGEKSPVNVMFLSATNDGTGAKWMLFCATNGTKRLFVRGRSEIELLGTPTNQTTTVQITNVDYLKPGQSITFLMRSPAPGRSWRLKFTYIGQFRPLEGLKYNVGWFLRRWGLPVGKLPCHDIREITTPWIND